MQKNLDEVIEFLKDFPFSIIICKNQEELPIEYMNLKADILFSPERSIQSISKPEETPQFTDFVAEKSLGQATAMIDTIKKVGRVEGWHCEFKSQGDQDSLFSVSANLASVNSEHDYIIFIIAPVSISTDHNPYTTQYLEMINVVIYEDETEQAINSLLSMAGQIVSASRVYVFEEISETTTRNTYEWCAEGIEPAIQDLQHLEKADYNYDVIISSGLYIANDVSKLPQEDREILESQGIYALAIIAMYLHDKGIGYIGFDDCSGVHNWTSDEIHFLQNISRLLLSFIRRRNAESVAKQNASLLQLVSDNSDDVIYVRDLEDYTLLMVNRTLSEIIGVPSEELVGKKCWKVIGDKQDGPCDYCPAPKISLQEGKESSEIYTWERLNPQTKKHYLIKDSLVRWSNGRIVHVETASDITIRKNNEEKLVYMASTDKMTEIFNREWGANDLQKKLNENKGGQLVFVDVDGLKNVNDTFGHEAGDDMLKAIVENIKAQINENDYMCRWGGDEFLVWTEGSRERAESVMDAANEALRICNESKKRDYPLSFSYGVLDFSGENFDALISKADALMYENKMQKRGAMKRRRRDDSLV